MENVEIIRFQYCKKIRITCYCENDKLKYEKKE